MISGKNMKSFSTWMANRLKAVPANKTRAVIVDQSEIKDNSLDFLSHLSPSKEFRQDLNMNGTYWFYDAQEHRRCLLVQYKKPESSESESDEKDKVVVEGESDADLAKHEAAMRQLGVSVTKALQSHKIDEVEIVVSSKVNPEHLGALYNSLCLCNYEFTKKSFIQEANALKDKEEKQTEKDEDADERSKKFHTKMASITLAHEKEDFASSETFKFHKAAAEATVVTRDLANERGNPADPDWMEAQIRRLFQGKEMI